MCISSTFRISCTVGLSHQTFWPYARYENNNRTFGLFLLFFQPIYLSLSFFFSKYYIYFNSQQIAPTENVKLLRLSFSFMTVTSRSSFPPKKCTCIFAMRSCLFLETRNFTSLPENFPHLETFHFRLWTNFTEYFRLLTIDSCYFEHFRSPLR